ncbi:MAG: DNA adenine methylase [Flavobacterium sp. BFFFF2]|nr:MAG: DNA adenine methylase [Flavobacterium sp. BFFFF2]
MLDTLPDEQGCRILLEEMLWKGVPTCNHCGVADINHYKMKVNGLFSGLFKCKKCRLRFTLTSSTLLLGTHIPLRKWVQAIYDYNAHNGKFTSVKLATDIGITQKSAWLMLQRIKKQFAKVKVVNNSNGSIIKWIGGKEQELRYILPKVPAKINNFYDPFCGGGSVFTAVIANRYYINDRSDELINLYQNIKSSNKSFLNTISEMDSSWSGLTVFANRYSKSMTNIYTKYSTNSIDENGLEKLLDNFVTKHSQALILLLPDKLNIQSDNYIKELNINLVRKIKRMKVLEKSKGGLNESDILDNLETAIKSAYYMHMRYLYNNMDRYKIAAPIRCALFYFIRNLCYSGIHRYNANNEINVPYGGISYNGKSFKSKIEYFISDVLLMRLKATKLCSLDFADFLDKHRPIVGDFLFLDPPYDEGFSSYSGNKFIVEDHIRLADYLINKCECKWMLVIKNTPLITKLYFNKRLHIYSFDKKYAVSFKDRNYRDVKHLMVTNY